MANSNNFNKKDDFNSKEENNLVVRPNTDITFNDSFFSRDDNSSSEKKEVHETTEVYETYDANDFYREEKRFSYNDYEREKRLAFGEEDGLYEEEGGNFKLLATLLSIGAIGIIGYFGFNYFQNNNKSDSTNINVTKDTDSNNSKVIKDSNEKIDTDNKITEEKKIDNKSLDSKSETIKENTSTPTEKPTPEAKETPLDDRQKEMIENVIKILKEKKEKSIAPTPAKVIESVEKEVVKDNKKPQIKENIEKKESKIVTTKIKKEKPKKPQYKVIVVKKGDTLASISERFYGNPMEFKRIIRANRDLKRGSTHLHLGQKLIIPMLPSSKGRRIVTVRKGDTLASIAKRFYGDHRKFQRIIDANYKIKNAHTPLHLGQKIYVPR